METGGGYLKWKWQKQKMNTLLWVARLHSLLQTNNGKAVRSSSGTESCAYILGTPFFSI